MRSVTLLMASTLAVVGSLTGCGGSKGGISTTTPVPVQQIVVAVSGPASTRLSATSQFAATVTGTSNTAVSWQVNGTAGGSAASGAISATGLYTAPTSIPAASVIVSAVSVASPSVSGSLTETLQNPVAVLTSATATQVGSSANYAISATGSGFLGTSSITVGGAAVATTFVSSISLTATVTVAAGTTSISVAVNNPDPGATLSAAVNVSIAAAQTTTVTAAAAARLLDQATFGPTAATITQVQSLGLDAWLNRQFATPTTPLAPIPTNPLPAACFTSNTAYTCAESEWWSTAINGNDQLRQRVAFALSEMFVVSTQSVPGQAIPQFHNALANDAFGNFATILHDVTLSPAMGAYLNMLNSAKPAAGQIANENYPRENMQLFTIGLELLNPDGSNQLDGNGNPIDAFNEAQVQAFARAYTGWTLANTAGGAVTKFPNSSGDYNDPMMPVDAEHDTTSKALLNGIVLPAGQSTTQDLSGALADLFNHPNVGPFVCRQLIQHLVTSTPSPAYVARVSAVFANNGSGVRGDMKAVLRAILLDQEARAGDTNLAYNGGHLREPILFITAMMRAFNFTNTDPNSSYASLSNDSNTLSERPYRANSVFNFFPPEFVIGGTTLNAPEFGIENTATATLRESLADSIVNNKIGSFTVDLSNTSAWGQLAATPSSLIDMLGTVLMHSQMPANMRTTLINTITPLTSNAQRVRVAIYLIVTSTQYKVIH